MRISKSRWYKMGGFRNSYLYRRQRNGVWQYMVMPEYLDSK
jgi:hypothetical protein